ncbi:AAA family ATPase [Myxococcus vastator]|uniref:AAA family ATPase n=1 Tax=Myxococcus vastator TaxID=2709664 RepID=UPI0013D5C1EF|nr:AAA family ATPase [Myxococcus vastator]
MHIQFVEIGNFRKLQSVRIDFAEETTVFVGANNSGKTSAMVALRHFLVARTEFTINDFTLSHWKTLNTIANTWESQTENTKTEPFNWDSTLPHLDVWLNVSKDELHFVQKILPTLDWTDHCIGVRLRYEPKDTQSLRNEYLTARRSAQDITNTPQPIDTETSTEATAALPGDFALWPSSMMDFLTRRLRSFFEVRAHLLDPAKLAHPENGEAFPQKLPDDSEPITDDPFKTLIRIDEISAQRGFGLTDSQASENEHQDNGFSRGGKKLSNQLRSYYSQHLDPFEQPEPRDLQALIAIHKAQVAFGDRLTTYFSDAINELENIGYPGIADPRLKITTQIKPIDGLNHPSAVQYEVPMHSNAAGTLSHRLPETSNGLGYQNLVSIVFTLMSFRDKWMRVGKASKSPASIDTFIPPIHLVLVEEPEAHLHAQVQQVFIKQAYDILRKHDKLKDSKSHRTQLIISTHSSHIAHEAKFESLRYFRRLPLQPQAGSPPISRVVNLSEIFGTKKKTDQFVMRYLKATHCDLFFADGAVLVEGPAERMLIPHFVRNRNDYKHLNRCYITWLEIGGSHAHRLKPLLSHLGLNTLIITDLDAKNSNNNATTPARGEGQRTRNETLKTWIPKEEDLDNLLDKKQEDLALSGHDNSAIRVAFQQPIKTTLNTQGSVEAIANTFEDSLVYENIDLFRNMDGHGLIKQFRDKLEHAATIGELSKGLTAALKEGKKAEFAMELLCREETDMLKVPTYIHNGLLWLSDRLRQNEKGITGNTPPEPTESMVDVPSIKSPQAAA